MCWRGCAPRPTTDTIVVPASALPNTPNSLLEREEEAHRVLARVRTMGQVCGTLWAMAHHVSAYFIPHAVGGFDASASAQRQQAAPPLRACNY